VLGGGQRPWQTGEAIERNYKAQAPGGGLGPFELQWCFRGLLDIGTYFD